MAGTLGAITKTEIPGFICIYNNNGDASRMLVFKPIRGNPLPVCFSFSRYFKMAQADQLNTSPEIKEPSTKVPKLSQNGVHEVSQGVVSVLRVKKLSEKAVLPSRGSPLAAGYDLSSATDTKVPARGKALVPTDLSIAIPEGTYGRVAPRSGLAWKHSIDVGAGVIDADYRGPLGVILFNHSDVDFEVKVGDRIAQLIVEKIMTPDVLEVDDLDSTARGDGGFGSTGV
ncbi:PREDICTED: LOW QUALITY PROTEIN: deoxyuridine 5'-triphosphate nucleotidohydrolase [Theobroma cacao]|uniref:Deoxyuridine 5'-triphosphate nucleotidohydrolase n=1 Tax=Theobroma cacao TaxID=3641 RepID=A0AB32UU18_THECC|nr:PREDICTED: LOW QUALITY PROTEIN: deoxyuridine 5'-triphosphate nucleotidohydrolase [Theobroma cacao]